MLIALHTDYSKIIYILNDQILPSLNTCTMQKISEQELTCNSVGTVVYFRHWGS